MACRMRSLIREESERDVAVLFDLEDTLVQTPWSSHQHVVEFRRSTREKLVDLGVPAVVLKEAQKTFEERRDLKADYVIQSLTEVPEIVQAEKGKIWSHS